MGAINYFYNARILAFHKDILLKFIIIGFPKCGTSALGENLDKHPDIKCFKGESHVFQRKKIVLRDYLNELCPGKINGETNPVYILEKSMMKNIHKTIPGVKLIICVRHPIQFMHSFYNHRANEYHRGEIAGINPKALSFNRLVLEEKNLYWTSNKNGCFIKMIKKNVLSMFPREQIHVIVQERMFSNVQHELNKVFEFLNLRHCEAGYRKEKSFDADYRYKTINYDSDAYADAVKKLYYLYKPFNEELFEFLGEEIGEWSKIEEIYKKIALGK